MGAFCCHINQTKKQTTTTIAILNCPYPSNFCTKLVLLLQWFRSCHLKKSFIKTECCSGNKIKWPPGHKTYKPGRQSSDDHNYQI